MKIRSASIAALLLAVVSLSATSAQADAFGITISQKSGLSGGQSISVQASNLPSDKGIYVLQCVLTDGALSRDPKDCTSTQNVGSALWISSSPGGANPSQAQLFTILRTINAKDCATNVCAIVSMRDHVDRSDRSFDSITTIKVSSISFGLDKSTNLIDAGDALSVTVSDLPSDKGVYVRQCALPADGARPTECDNAAAVWASNVPSALTQGGVDASKAIALNLKGAFVGQSGLVDCQLVVCGVYLERDWNGLSDRSLDTFVPVSFAAPIAVKQVVSGWKKSPGAVRLKVGKSLELAKKSLKTKQGNALTWASNSPKICKVVKTSKTVSVKAVKAGNCVVTALVPETTRALAKTFSWKVKVSK